MTLMMNLIVLLAVFVIFGLSCLVVAGILHLVGWVWDRWQWIRWFSWQ